MNKLRLATEEEIDKIANKSHFTSRYTVFAMDQKGEPDIAVVREAVMLDPVFFSKDGNIYSKARFMEHLEERLAGAGIPEVYYQISAADIHWQRIVEAWGAVKVSGEPEFQYKRSLS